MARIQHCSESPITLAPSHIVGRDPESHTAIDRPSVSGQHAVFSWFGSGWRLRDLGSRNGTYLNARHLQARDEVVMEPGDQIAFAERDEVWVVVDAHPPAPTLMPMSSGDATRAALVEADGIFVACAHDESPWNIFYTSGNWYLEDQQGRQSMIESDDRIELDGHTYRVRLPASSEDTRDANSPPVEARLENSRMLIRVSADEETAAVTLDVGHRRYDLDSRAHLYLLAYLARARQADVDETGGWVDTKTAMRDLQLTCGTQLGVHVFRCRSDLAVAVANPADVIDRSRRGLLRIGLSAERLSVSNGPK